MRGATTPCDRANFSTTAKANRIQPIVIIVWWVKEVRELSIRSELISISSIDGVEFL